MDSIAIGCGFPDSQIMAARNRSISQIGGPSKTLTLKLEWKIMLTTYIDITDRLFNGQIGVVKYFKYLGDKVDIIYIKCDDINAGKKLIQAGNRSRHNRWAPIKKTDTHINIRNSYISASIQWTQFLLTLEWAYTVHKVHGLSLPKLVISLELEKQKSFRYGQIYVAFSRVTNIEGFYLTSTFKKDAIKANREALNKYDHLQKEALFTPVSLRMSFQETLSFILLNVRSLKRHAIDIAYDKKLIEYDILHTEMQVSQKDELSAMQSILKEYTLDHNISSFRYFSIAICYKSTILVSSHEKNDGVLFSQVFEQTYSGKVIRVELMHRKYTESVSLFYEKSETLNAREEVDIILRDFKCPRPTSDWRYF